MTVAMLEISQCVEVNRGEPGPANGTWSKDAVREGHMTPLRGTTYCRRLRPLLSTLSPPAELTSTTRITPQNNKTVKDWARTGLAHLALAICGRGPPFEVTGLSKHRTGVCICESHSWAPRALAASALPGIMEPSQEERKVGTGRVSTTSEVIRRPLGSSLPT